METLAELALAYLKNGLSVIPIHLDPVLDRDKKPVGSWKAYQERTATGDELDSWMMNSRVNGVAIVCGTVSGNLEMIDFDFKAAFAKEWADRIKAADPALYDSLVCELSKNGGAHFLYRCEIPVPGNTKLASKLIEPPDPTATTMEFMGKQIPVRAGMGVACMIETRGQGGFVACYPTPGYSLHRNDYLHLPTITAKQRELLISTAMAMDEEPKVQAARKREAEFLPDRKRPGDDFAARVNVAEYLKEAGWEPSYSSGVGQHWTRPGKDGGPSATLFDGSNYFYVFTSNAPPFKPSTAYSPMGVYAELKCGGDYKAAARALAALGFGDQTPFKPQKTTAFSEPEAIGEEYEATARRDFEPPDFNQVTAALAGTPLGVYVEEASKLGHGLPFEYVLLDAIMLAGSIMATNGVKVSAEAGKPKAPNVYGCKIGYSGQSKGYSSELMLELATYFGVFLIDGKSQPAIYESMLKDEKGPHGIYYVEELSEIINQFDPVGSGVMKTLTKLYDSGKSNWTTRKQTLDLPDVAPSALFLGQPGLIEKTPATKMSIDTGFVGRCLIAYPTESKRRRGQRQEKRFVDKQRIKTAYAVFKNHVDAIVQPPFELDYWNCRMLDYIDDMTDGELSVMTRLRYVSAPRIAMMLNPAALRTGIITQEDVQRTAPIIDFLFGQAQKFLGILHDDPHQRHALKFENFVAEHPGCTESEIARGLQPISEFEFQRVRKTVVLRGGAYERKIETTSRQKMRWFSGRKAAALKPEISRINPLTTKSSVNCSKSRTDTNSNIINILPLVQTSVSENSVDKGLILLNRPQTDWTEHEAAFKRGLPAFRAALPPLMVFPQYSFADELEAATVPCEISVVVLDDDDFDL